MSSSLFRHEFGMEQALRLRDAGDHGARSTSWQHGRATRGKRLVHLRTPPGLDGDDVVWAGCRSGQHVHRQEAHGPRAHHLPVIACRPRCGTVGRDLAGQYCQTSVYFARQVPHLHAGRFEGDFWYGHHYEMFRMAHTFREMIARGESLCHIRKSLK